MSGWISGEDLIRLLKIEPFEILKYADKAYTRQGRKLRDGDPCLFEWGGVLRPSLTYKVAAFLRGEPADPVIHSDTSLSS